MDDEKQEKRRIQTTGIHGGEDQNPTSGVSSPIFQSSTFRFSDPKEMAEAMASKAHPQFYGRYGTPNTRQVESALAGLEGGEAALVTASGMAAISLVMLSYLKAGDHLIAQRNIYPTSYNLIHRKLSNLGIEVTFVDQGDRMEFEKAIRSNTRLIYAESPANPMISLTDLRHIAALAQTHDIISVVDNTFATPYNQHPLELGCDIVIHSATKYLSGHSDVVGGAIVSNRESIEKIWSDHVLFGAILHPFEAWLLGRGLKTFGIRMERHNSNAVAVASFLENHLAVKKVHYPGLDTHPQHELAREQMPGGFGGMMSFNIKGGESAAFKTLERFEIISLATSLGGDHSLISHPHSTVSSVQSEDVRSTVGVDAGLLRLSIGLEDVEDITMDLERALSVRSIQSN
jgi:methionine-gamma-lyase